jgi:Endoplasmic Reticulum Oxidoreductin 1 (ERO1)
MRYPKGKADGCRMSRLFEIFRANSRSTCHVFKFCLPSTHNSHTYIIQMMRHIFLFSIVTALNPLSYSFHPTLAGVVKDAECKFVTVENLNQQIYPILVDLRKTSVFRYFKVNLYKDCPFWREELLCTNPDCSVDIASEVHLANIG